MFDARPLTHLSFWFAREPGPLTVSSSQILFAVFAVLFTLGVIIRVVATKRRHEDRYVASLFRRIGGMLVTMGILGLVWFFYAYEEIPFLGARFWVLAWGVIGLIWIARIVRFAKRDVPAHRAFDATRAAREKYLPKSKK